MRSSEMEWLPIANGGTATRTAPMMPRMAPSSAMSNPYLTLMVFALKPIVEPS